MRGNIPERVRRRNNRNSALSDFPAQPDGARRVQFLDVDVHASGAGEALVARLPAEQGEPRDLEVAALFAVGGHSQHLPSLQRFHGQGVASLVAKTENTAGVRRVHGVEHTKDDTLSGDKGRRHDG